MEYFNSEGPERVPDLGLGFWICHAEMGLKGKLNKGHFENPSNMQKNWQKMKKILAQLALQTFFGGFRVPEIQFRVPDQSLILKKVNMLKIHEN